MKLNIVRHGKVTSLKYVDEVTTEVTLSVSGSSHTFYFYQKEGLVPIIGQTFRLHLEAL